MCRVCQCRSNLLTASGSNSRASDAMKVKRKVRVCVCSAMLAHWLANSKVKTGQASSEDESDHR